MKYSMRTHDSDKEIAEELLATEQWHAEQLAALETSMHILKEQTHRLRAEQEIARSRKERLGMEVAIIDRLPATAEHRADGAALRGIYGRKAFGNGDCKPLMSDSMRAWTKENGPIEARLWMPDLGKVPLHQWQPVVCLYARSQGILERFANDFAQEITQRWG